LRRYATSWKVVSSSSDEVIVFFQFNFKLMMMMMLMIQLKPIIFLGVINKVMFVVGGEDVL
jgi:hypothetical protein